MVSHDTDLVGMNLRKPDTLRELLLMDTTFSFDMMVSEDSGNIVEAISADPQYVALGINEDLWWCTTVKKEVQCVGQLTYNKVRDGIVQDYSTHKKYIVVQPSPPCK